MSVIRDYGAKALAQSLILMLGTMLVAVLWYKARFGFFDRTVKFFLQGPITFARLMGVGMVMSVFYLRGIMRLLAIVVFFFAVVWTGSKGPIVACALTFGVLLLFGMDRKLRNFSLIILALLALVGARLLAEIDLGFLRLDRISLLWSIDFDALRREGDYNSFTGRYWIAVRTFELIAARPFGAGLGGWESLVSNNLGLQYPHNLFLELWSESGLFLGSLAALSFTAFVVSPRSVWKYCALFYFLCQLFSGDLLDARYLLVFSILSYFVVRNTARVT